jgi:hypothetical protein
MESSQEASAVAPSLDPSSTSTHLGLDSSDILNGTVDTDFPADSTMVQNLITEHTRDGTVRSILITLVAPGKPYSRWEGIGHVYRNSHYVYESSTGRLAQSWYYTLQTALSELVSHSDELTPQEKSRINHRLYSCDFLSGLMLFAENVDNDEHVRIRSPGELCTYMQNTSPEDVVLSSDLLKLHSSTFVWKNHRNFSTLLGSYELRRAHRSCRVLQQRLFPIPHHLNQLSIPRQRPRLPQSRRRLRPLPYTTVPPLVRFMLLGFLQANMPPPHLLVALLLHPTVALAHHLARHMIQQ